MYPPRSSKYREKKQEKQKRQSRAWTIINLCLIVLIGLLFSYYFFAEDLGLIHNPDTNRADEYSAVSDQLSVHNEGQTSETITANQRFEGKEQAGSSTHNNANPAKTDTLSDNQEKGDDHTVTLHFVGDVMFSGRVQDKLLIEGNDYPYRYVKERFLNDDLTVANLETPVTARGTGAANKTYVFKSSPDALAEMAKSGFDVVNAANNHILDQGQEGLLDTLKFIDLNKMKAIGAGRNQKEAYSPVYVERKGMKIALFGFSRVLPDSSWNAGENKPGVAGVYNPPIAIEQIKKARKQADLVIVIIHWGTERVDTVDKNQSSLAHSFVEAGADLVVGGHPHVMQGIEQYNNKWIVYSTGNFIFTKSTVPKTWETAIFEAKCDKGRACSLKLIPYWAELAQPVPMNAKDSQALLKRVQSISSGITIRQDGTVISNR
ncbi:CapA family protein [Paenibacillus sediminis]|uniref:Poly-gamma-glutamate synthesis protein (Capsule biosynthesis protein) n=1 Tax=Paenibacillus sediminis TaxID=664909 RepID=A0ABS4H5F7_9BACL|nr:CapA family protein [Paenibacillus sediminis]MBP1937769.1 poly-gamma-glutamate synthesis protein (capsule biosynthesis protein) [Paenibacillus sediminis]